MEEEQLTGEIIKVFYKVYNTLGHGFVESVYHNAMVLELIAGGFVVESQKPISVYYDSRLVGTFAADIVVNGKILLELNSKERIIAAHEAQLVNYLKATEIEIGLLFNFGKNPEFRRNTFRIRTSSLPDPWRHRRSIFAILPVLRSIRQMDRKPLMYSMKLKMIRFNPAHPLHPL